MEVFLLLYLVGGTSPGEVIRTFPTMWECERAIDVLARDMPGHKYICQRRCNMRISRENKRRIPLLLPVRVELAQSSNLNSFSLVKKTFFLQSKRTIEKFTYTYMDQVCLARVQGARFQKGDIAYFIDYPFYEIWGRKGKRKFSKVERHYLRWVLRKSAWRGVFLTKNLKEAQALGIVYDTTFPSRFVVQGAMLTRYPAEFPAHVKLWHKCREYTDPHIALALCQSMYPLKGGKEFYFRAAGTANSNHQAFTHREVGTREIKKMINNKPHLATPPMSRRQSFKNLSYIWNGDDGARINEERRFSFPKESGEEVVVSTWGNMDVRCNFKTSEMREVVREFLSINKLMRYYYG